MLLIWFVVRVVMEVGLVMFRFEGMVIWWVVIGDLFKSEFRVD